MSWYRWEGEDLRLWVRVRPRAREDGFDAPDPDGRFYGVRLKAPPVEGQANESLRRLIADAFAVPLKQVEIISGAQGRIKCLRIQRPRRLPQMLAIAPCSG